MLVAFQSVELNGRDRGSLHCAQLQSFIAAGVDCDVV